MTKLAPIHELLVTIEAMTRGEFKKKGEGLVIRYGFHPTPFGECILAITERGICGLAFTTTRGRSGAVNDLKVKWTNAALVEDDVSTAPLIGTIFTGPENKEAFPVKLMLAGTDFQISVWEALLKIPRGSMVSYEFVASAIGKPAAVRAVGSAVGSNPVGYIIPCHRVVRKSGAIGDYAWGAARKKAMLGWEAAKEA